jgi:hypothetical protein
MVAVTWVIMILTRVKQVHGKVVAIAVVTGFQHQNLHQHHQAAEVAENQHHQVVEAAEVAEVAENQHHQVVEAAENLHRHQHQQHQIGRRL